MEFTYEQDEQDQDAARTRVEELTISVLSLSSNPEIDFLQKGNQSDVSVFVNRHPRFTFKPLARRSIHTGIKHLVFERVLKHKLQQLQLPDDCEAISAALGLNINQFKSLRYQQIPAVVDELLSDAMILVVGHDKIQKKNITRH